MCWLHAAGKFSTSFHFQLMWFYYHLSDEFHHIIQLHHYIPISSIWFNFIHIVIFVHVINSTIWRFLLAIFIQMCRFHLSSKLHQQVCQYIAISSIWFIFIHVTSSLKLFHLIKKMLSNFIDLVRSAPLFRFVFYNG